MAQDTDPPHLSAVIEMDVADRESERAKATDELVKTTITCVLQMFGREYKGRMLLHPDDLTDGHPAPSLDDWRFWAPRGLNGPLEAWVVRKDGAIIQTPKWVPVSRPADLDEFDPGQVDRTPASW